MFQATINGIVIVMAIAIHSSRTISATRAVVATATLVKYKIEARGEKEENNNRLG